MAQKDYEKTGNKHIDLTAPLSLPYHHKIASLVCEYANPESRIIDLGCGVGQLADLIERQRPELKLDIADAYQACLDQTQERAGNINRTFLIDEASFDVTSKVSGGYDVIVMSHVLEHLIFPALALDEVFSLLNPDGIMIVAVPNPSRPNLLITNLLRKHYVNRGHVHSWDRSHWINFLETIMGFDVIRYESDFIQFPLAIRLSPIRWLGTKLVAIAPWLGFSNIAVIKRSERGETQFAKWKKTRGELALQPEVCA